MSGGCCSRSSKKKPPMTDEPAPTNNNPVNERAARRTATRDKALSLPPRPHVTLRTHQHESFPFRLFVVRLEERGSDPTFYSPLLQRGVMHAGSTLQSHLSSIPISLVLCSPFQRTLQTVEPYSKQYGVPINIEYGLYELLSAHSHSAVGILSADDIDGSLVDCSLLNRRYKPIVPVSDLAIGESLDDVEERVARVAQGLVDRYSGGSVTDYTAVELSNTIDTATRSYDNYTLSPLGGGGGATQTSFTGALPRHNILIVTHMHPVNAFIKLANPEYSMHSSYGCGIVTEINVFDMIHSLNGRWR